MPKNIEKAMPGKNQVNISLSDGAESEFELVANWLGVPKASLLRQKLEEVHQSPNFASVLRRAKAAQQARVEIEALTQSLREHVGGDSKAVELINKLEKQITALVSGVPRA
ncbi:hypothetical protein QGP82_14600 [Leptothoe sp. LEGE 181152]|nr:hypothetical protein [Leptothoe sp. LEGE 181152]